MEDNRKGTFITIEVLGELLQYKVKDNLIEPFDYFDLEVIPVTHYVDIRKSNDSYYETKIYLRELTPQTHIPISKILQIEDY
jgi:hypothetical protein